MVFKQKQMKLLSRVITLIFVIIFFCCFFSSCKDDEQLPGELHSANPFFNNFTEIDQAIIDNEGIDSIDKVKIALSNSLSNLFLGSDAVSDLKELIINSENNRILASEFNSVMIRSESLLELLVKNLDPSESDLSDDIEDICSNYPHMSIGFPQWVTSIPSSQIEELELVVFPVLKSGNGRWLGIRLSDGIIIEQKKNRPYNYIPIQVKEAEDLIPYHETDLSTIWGDNLIEDHFQALSNCKDEIAAISDFSISVFCNPEIKLLRIFTFRDHLIENCRVSLSNAISNESSNDCDQNYERNCIFENNVIENITLVSSASWSSLSNQVGGEDAIQLNYVFVASTMCGNLNEFEFCPSSSWTLSFIGKQDDFFDIQFIEGNQQGSEGIVIWESPLNTQEYITVKPKEYDVNPLEDSSSFYVEQFYLKTTLESHWNANILGSGISFYIYEHDNLIVEQPILATRQLGNISRVPFSLINADSTNVDDIQFASFEFTDILRRSFQNITIDLVKDVELGSSSSQYQDQNFENEVIGFGINKSTGSVSTKFAYYH